MSNIIVHPWKWPQGWSDYISLRPWVSFIAAFSAMNKPSCDFLEEPCEVCEVRDDHTCERTSLNMSQGGQKRPHSVHSVSLSAWGIFSPDMTHSTFCVPSCISDQLTEACESKQRGELWIEKGCKHGFFGTLSFNTSSLKALCHRFLPLRRFRHSSL